MAVYTGPVQDLVDELGKLPGIGPKSAQRIAFHLLKLPRDDANRLASAITEAKARVSWCERCFNVASAPLCDICSDERRDGSIICVVEEPRDVVAVEKTLEFKGRYHVLGGAMNPLEGIGADQLRMKELFARIAPESVEELILCTNPNVEGEATAMYLARMFADMPPHRHPHRQRRPRRRRPGVRRRAHPGRALEGRRNVVEERGA